MLCGVCERVLERYENEYPSEVCDKFFGHHRNSAAIHSAAVLGCYICSRIWRTLSIIPLPLSESEFFQKEDIRVRQEESTPRKNGNDQIATDEFYTYAQLLRGTWRDYDGDRPDDFRLWFQVGLEDGPNGYLGVGSFYLERLSEKESATRSISMTSAVSGDTLSEVALEHAKGWLTECIQSHPMCNNTTSPIDWFPTRLLYIKEIQHNQYHVRLINTAQERPSGPYITLSHRWGELDHLRLTRDTFSLFSEALPVSELTKTFQETISVTFRLGISYLWIDSLCIMQDKDDLSDWLREASVMEKVYLHSHCNISASVSLDGSQGLSRERDLAKLDLPTVRLLTRASGVDLEDHREAFELSDDRLWEYNVADSPINTRGWVFQERLLAPRVLHFSHDQLFWECRRHRTCEVPPRSDAPLGGNLDTSLAKFRTYFQKHAISSISMSSTCMDRNVQDSKEAYDVWQDLIEAYSGTNLTNPLDKLVALSGIAKLMSTFVEGTYIAGMWRENIERDLLWFKDVYSQEFAPKPSANLYRAPSWSWASRDGKIRFSGVQGDVLFAVRDVFVQHKTQDVTGHVISGWLEVAGKLGPITLSYGKGYKSFEHRTVWKIDNDTWASPKANFFFVPDEITTNARNFDNDNLAGKLFFMPCLLDRSEDFPMYAMVLRIVDRDNGVFERIGMAVGLEDLGDGEIPPLPTDVGEHIKATFPCLKYEDGLHTVRII